MAKEIPQVNDKIKAEKILLINEKGDKVGVISREEALKTAEEAGLDLVAVNPNSDPMVCKIMDYGKHKYLQKKKTRHKGGGGKKSHATKIKELRLRPKIEAHDLGVKVKHATNS